MNNKQLLEAVKNNDYGLFYDLLTERECQETQNKLFTLFVNSIESDEKGRFLISLFLCYGASMFTEGKNFVHRIKEKGVI